MAEQKKPTKARSITRTFISDGGDETPRASNETKAVKLSFTNGASLSYDLAHAFGGSLPAPCVGRAAAAFGISTSLGNAGNTAGAAETPEGEAPDPETIYEAVEARLERLNSGVWAAERESGGPATSLLVEAYILYRKAAGAPPPDSPRIEAFKVKVSDKAARDTYLTDPDFLKAYTEAQMARRSKRAALVAGAAADLKD